MKIERFFIPRRRRRLLYPRLGLKGVFLFIKKKGEINAGQTESYIVRGRGFIV